MEKTTVVLKANFNPIIQTYILLYVAFFLLISLIGIPLLVIWLLGPGQWYSRHYFQKLECELTDTHLRFKKGIFFQVEKTIPLENIQDMTFLEGPLLRALHLTVVKVETAGQSVHQGHEMSLTGIIDADFFRKMVLEQRQHILQHRGTNGQKNHLEEIELTLKNIERILKERNT